MGRRNGAVAAMKTVIEQIPTLAYTGVMQLWKLPKEERKEKLAEGQKQLLANADKFLKVCEWLDGIRPTKSTYPGIGSYGLKHIAENNIGAYVSNGTLIAAAVHKGFPYRLIPGSLNVRFGMWKRDVALACIRGNVKQNPALLGTLAQRMSPAQLRKVTP